jgi:hypothetical protein
MDGRDFLARIRRCEDGSTASVPSASDPVIGVSTSEGGPVGPVRAVPHLFPKNPSIFNENIGERDGAGSKGSDSVRGIDDLYTLDGDTWLTGVLHIDRTRTLHSSRGRRVSCVLQSVSVGNR